LTPAGRELSTVIEALAIWGMRWARDKMGEDDLDVCFLMFDVQRRIDTSALPDGETVLGFTFNDLDHFGRWWLVCQNGEVDLCYADPGKDVDCYVICASRALIDVWMGDLPLPKALKSGAIQVVGERQIASAIQKWFTLAVFAKTPRPTKAERLSDSLRQ
jgi:putative sterol carrier protein